MSFNPLSLVLGLVKSSNPLLAFGISMAQSALNAANVPAASQGVAIQRAQDDHLVQIQKKLDDHPTVNTVTIAAVKSAWWSKINWVQFAGPVASAFAAFGLNLSPEEIVASVMSIHAGQSVLTWVLRTWFSKNVTKASAGLA